MADSLEKEIKKPWKGRFWKGFVLSTVMLAVLLGAPKGVECRRRKTRIDLRNRIDFRLVYDVVKLNRFKSCSEKRCELVVSKRGPTQDSLYDNQGKLVQKITLSTTRDNVFDGSGRLIEYIVLGTTRDSFHRPNGSIDRILKRGTARDEMTDGQGRLLQSFTYGSGADKVYNSDGSVKWTILRGTTEDRIYDNMDTHIYSITYGAGRDVIWKINSSHFEQGQNYYELARRLEEEGNVNYNLFYQKALNQFTLATKKNPKNGEGWRMRGNSLMHLGNCFGAIEMFDKAIALNSRDADAWNSKGSCSYSIGLTEKACFAWRKANSLGSPYAQSNLETYCK